MCARVPGSEFSRLRIGTSLATYSLGHAIVDAICAGVLLSIWWQGELPAAEMTWLFLYYNLLAFGAQPVLGSLLDHLRWPRFGAVAGCLITASSTACLEQWPILSVTLAGVGNALFHLGGGTITLNLTPGRASAPGIFVAPGALGLAIGIYLGTNGLFVSWPFLALLAPLAVLMALMKPPTIDYHRSEAEVPVRWMLPALLLLLTCVAVRSLIGANLVFPWKTEVLWLVVLITAVVLGKGLGGWLADRFGWARVAVGALALSIPLLAFGPGIPTLAIIGVLLFNMTMPVTLAATANVLPGRPAFAFGLTCLALEVGAWPGKLVFGEGSGFGGEWLALAVMLVSVAALYFGLRLAFARLPGRFSCVRP